MNTTVDLMREFELESEIPPGCEIHTAITEALLQLVPSLLFFTYESRKNSFCARSQEVGRSRRCAVITLFLRFDSDFAATGVDHHSGNWRDQWKATDSIRDTFNRVLAWHGYDKEMIDEQSFVFPYSFEEKAFRRLGKQAKPEIPGLLERIAGATCPKLFWLSDSHTYYVLVDDPAERRMVKKKMVSICNAISDLLRSLDVHGRCENYAVKIEMIDSGTNTFHLYREDY